MFSCLAGEEEGDHRPVPTLPHPSPHNSAKSQAIPARCFGAITPARSRPGALPPALRPVVKSRTPALRSLRALRLRWALPGPPAFGAPWPELSALAGCAGRRRPANS